MREGQHARDRYTAKAGLAQYQARPVNGEYWFDVSIVELLWALRGITANIEYRYNNYMVQLDNGRHVITPKWTLRKIQEGRSNSDGQTMD